MPELATPAEDTQNKVQELQREQLVRTALRALGVRCQRLVEMLFFESPPRPYQDVAHSWH